MTLEVDAVVVGAGVVGLAIARALQQDGREVWLLDQARTFGTETSSRNSEVIHAGIYYPAGSLKARLCVRGRSLLYAYCRDRGVPHRRIGKLIVACDAAEVPTLEGYERTAIANGVADLEWRDASAIAHLEPAVRASAALWSPSTGIVDSHALMQALLDDFEAAGGQFVRASRVRCGEVGSTRLRLVLDDADETRLQARTIVNSAGLQAPTLARSFDGLPARCIPPAHLAIGHYYALSGPSPFRHLVYPVAEAGGLGVHVTIDLAGAARFGPDVRWRDTIDYRFDDSTRARFVTAIRRYHPTLDEAALAPAFTGIRPKLGGPGTPAQDFVIQGVREHGVAGLVNLFGIESPGLTASLAIAESVAAMLR